MEMQTLILVSQLVYLQIERPDYVLCDYAPGSDCTEDPRCRMMQGPQCIPFYPFRMSRVLSCTFLGALIFFDRTLCES